MLGVVVGKYKSTVTVHPSVVLMMTFLVGNWHCAQLDIELE